MTRALALILLLVTTPAHADMAFDVTKRVRASWYDCRQPGECSRSKHTASGERFDATKLTCAHRTLRFGTIVRVAYAGRSINCRISDRGPHKRTHREIDLSLGAAAALGMIGAGVATVDMRVVR